MDIELIQARSSTNGEYNGGGGSSRRIDDSTLYDLIRSDRNLVIFLMVLGYFIDDERNSYTVKIIARIWQGSLLIFGGIGFCWNTFIYGGYSLKNLYDSLSSSSNSIGVFIHLGDMLSIFVI